METIQVQNGNVITTVTTTIDVATYIAHQEANITQYQANIDSLQHQIDNYNLKIVDAQALITQVS